MEVRTALPAAEPGRPEGSGVPMLLADPKSLKLIADRLRGEGVGGVIKVEYDVRRDGTVVRCTATADVISAAQEEELCRSAVARRYQPGVASTVTAQYLAPHLK